MANAPKRFRPESSEEKQTYGFENIPSFRKDAHEDMITRRGVKVLWERSFLCTCFNPMTRAADTLCPICHGRGIGYMLPKETYIALQSQKRNPMNQQYGLYDAGTSQGTTLPDSPITFNDRITVVDSIIEHSFVFDVTEDRITNGMWLSYDTEEITYAITDGREELLEGEDYKFVEEDNIIFPDESLLGKNISLNIKAKLRFIVTDLLKESRMQYIQKGNKEEIDYLSKLLLLKREDNWVNSTPFSLEGGTKEVPLEMPTEKDNPERKSDGFFGGALNG